VRFSQFCSNDGTNQEYSRSLTCLLGHGLFEPEKGDTQKFSQRNAHYAATVGSHLSAKIHRLESSVGELDHHQNHPVDFLAEHIDFVGEASDRVGHVVDKVNECINVQDIQTE
jgi:hypothetical protein